MSVQVAGSGTGVKSMVKLTPDSEPEGGPAKGVVGLICNVSTSPAVTLVGVKPFTMPTTFWRFCPTPAVPASICAALSDRVKLLLLGPKGPLAFQKKPE